MSIEYIIGFSIGYLAIVIILFMGLGTGWDYKYWEFERKRQVYRVALLSLFFPIGLVVALGYYLWHEKIIKLIEYWKKLPY